MPTTVTDIRKMAGTARIAMMTAYDAPTAKIADEQGLDILLVGDSLGNTSLGYDSTLPVTVDDTVRHTAAVARAAKNALVVADMPFLSFGVDDAESVTNAGRMIKEAGAKAVKIESGPHTVELTRKLTQLGIPVMAHLGLTPQQVNQLGGYTRQGTTRESATQILDLAKHHEEAGAFSLVLEHVPANLAAQVTEALEIPTIGIGAGPDTDGQVLVVDDVVGLSDWQPPFAKQFGNVRKEMEQAIGTYADEVRSGSFPDPEHSHVEEDLDDLY
ncbi:MULTISPECIES: 3-methyl-2-oxobutanoate hydroxymethyltransferase [unclassified Haladaptatus]|uniref:3-methyl-2-oxobutanoate hydroxymethyltransferase n=1 Tax=unclassified Haladaptatus TaxID=2622732 RepID=UPI0023E8FA7B|nr:MULTISPECIES: 3-methyl-2-oxobutanoate hydroxymethyltransferase [unclassified Haladaptatus]